MRIPLANRLKKRLHREIAELQDEVVDIVYEVASRSVFHGGTAIWRCYEGNRFSEDLDFYLPLEENLKDKLLPALSSQALSLLKYKKTENTIFSRISNGVVEIKLEFALRKFDNPCVRPYEKINGSYMDVYTLTPEQLILEKILAYKDRKLVRDIYDIYLLLRYANVEGIRPIIKKFLDSLEPPLDEKNLRTILYSGAVPSFKQMVESLRRGIK